MERKLRMFYDQTKFLLFILFNGLVTVLRAIYWWLTGRAAEIKAHQAVYEVSAHKMGFAYKYMLDLLFEPGRYNFGLYHEEFVHPEYVLRDEVSLMQITATEAIFIESKKDALPAYKACYNFLFNGQYATAHKVITMPLKSMLRLAQDIENEGAKVIFIYNQSRVGSTLMSSIFEHTNRCITFSEPHPLNAACKMVFIDKVFEKEEGLALIRDTLRVLCKPFRSLPDKVLAYAIKPTAPTLATADLIQEAMPDSIPLFMYRDPVAVGQSIRRLSEAVPSLKMLHYLIELQIPNIIYISLTVIGQVAAIFKGFTPKAGTGIEFGYFLSMAMLHYRDEMRKKGLDMPAIRFEDLRDHPKAMVHKIFKVCGLPDSLVDLALEAMTKDAHSATDFSQKLLRQLMPVLPKPTPKFIEEMRVEAKRLGVPEPEVWTRDYHVENSIVP